MSSSKEYLYYVLEQLSGLEEISYKAMMGEFIIYFRGKIIGGIYDDRLLVKPTKSALAHMPTGAMELPYDGAKEMLLVENTDDKEFLNGLFNAMYDELPMPKRKKEKKIVKTSDGVALAKALKSFMESPQFLRTKDTRLFKGEFPSGLMPRKSKRN